MTNAAFDVLREAAGGDIFPVPMFRFGQTVAFFQGTPHYESTGVQMGEVRGVTLILCETTSYANKPQSAVQYAIRPEGPPTRNSATEDRELVTVPQVQVGASLDEAWAKLKAARLAKTR